MTIERIAMHLRVPLFRSGYALTANTVIVSGLGALYWVVAARLLEPGAVGVGAGLISAMALLTSLSIVGLDYGLTRFVPAAGTSTAGLIAGAYAVAAPISAVAAVVFTVGVGRWAPDLEMVRSSPWAVVGFVGATTLWTVFVLQDAALAGLRRATWLPIENGFYGATKLLLLAVLVGVSADLRVFASWTLPLVPIVVAVNVLMFRKAIPAHVAATPSSARPLRRREVAHFAIRDYAASTLLRSTGFLLPLIVIAQLDAEANAYFYVAWTIAYALHLVSRATGVALITEGALEPAKLTAFSRQVIMQTGAIVTPVVLGAIVAAPLILSIFGADYAAAGTTVLRLLVLAAIPNMFVTLFAAICRVEGRMRSILYVNAITLVSVVALSLLLIPRIGIVGVGWAWLGVQTTIAIVLMWTRLRPIWLPMLADVPLASRIGSWFGPARRVRSESTAAQAKVPNLLAAMERRLPQLGPLHIKDMLPTELDLVVASLRDEGGDPVAVIKLAATEGAGASVRREARVLELLHDDARLGAWLSLVPHLLDDGEVDGLSYFVETYQVGRSARDLAADPRHRSALTSAAAHAIAPFHAATGAAARVTPDLVDRWVHQPIADLLTLTDRRDRASAARRARATHLGDRLGSELLDADVVECWIHGDYWLGNLMVDEANTLTGIVDWAQADESGLAAFDLLHLVLTSRVLSHEQPFGAAVLTALSDPQWTQAEQEMLAVSPAAGSQASPDLNTLILLTWLRHVASNVRKSYRYRRSSVWIGQNVDEVLSAVR